jgi:hypothetical protein
MAKFDYKRPGDEQTLEGGGSGGGYKTSGSKFNTAMDVAGGVAPVAAVAALMGKYYTEEKKDKSDRESEAELKRETRGKAKGGAVKMAKGGSASARADGIAQRGKTKGRMC